MLELFRDVMLRVAARDFARGLNGELLLVPRGVADSCGTAAGEDVPASGAPGALADGGPDGKDAPDWLNGDDSVGMALPGRIWDTVGLFPVADLGGEPAKVGGREKKCSGGG